MEENIYQKVSDISGTPRPNEDAETGIHYGVIAANSLSGDAIGDVCNGRDLTYEESIEQVKASLQSAIREALRDSVLFEETLDRIAQESTEEIWERFDTEITEHWESSGSTYLYEEQGYSVLFSSDSGYVIVQKSPYFALRGFCSPCFPNAGDLDAEGIHKTYALTEDWYEDMDGSGVRVPYSVYDVKTDRLVRPCGRLVRTVEIDSHRLEVFDLERQREDGKHAIGYRLFHNSLAGSPSVVFRTGSPALIFCGEDIGSPSAVDSDETCKAILSFLTLRKGDTDSEYFANYTPEQTEWMEAHAEALGLWALPEATLPPQGE